MSQQRRLVSRAELEKTLSVTILKSGDYVSRSNSSATNLV